jgi:two-component system, cell cycle sensor histidine kinase and response regulator CckA
MKNGLTKTVLVVDDEPVVLSLLASLLKLKGIAVIEAGSGPKAIELAHQFIAQIDLLITDVLMHPMSGIEVAGSLRRLNPIIPVIYISGYAPPKEIIAEEAEKGAATFIRKPFANAEFISQVCRSLGI